MNAAVEVPDITDRRPGLPPDPAETEQTRPVAGRVEADPPLRLSGLLAPRDRELGRALTAIAIGSVGQLAGIGLLASSAWLITTASLRPPVLTLTVAIAAVQLFALSRGVARYGERLASHDLAFRVLARLRVWVFAHLEPLVPAHWPDARRGDLLSRFIADVDGIQDLYVRSVLPLAASVVTASATVVTAAFLDPAAGLALGAGLFIGAVAAPITAALLGARGGSQLADRRGRRDALIVEFLHSADELAVFDAVTSQLARLETTERDVARQARRASWAASLGAASSVGLAGLLAVTVAAAALPALTAGRVPGVTVAVLAFLGFAAAEAVSGLPEAFAAFTTTLAGARRVLALSDGPDPCAASQDPCPTMALADPTSTPPTAAARPAPRLVPTLILDDVTVAYDPDRPPALAHLTLRVDAGRHLAVIGPSGAGKTTLGHLLLGFVAPSEGRLTLDGVDVKRLDPEAVRQLIAWAPQDPHIFHTTVAANLRLARPDATDSQLAAVLDHVGLGPWLAGLPGQLDTPLGERGTTLSGGERQRLGVARALLADRPVLVLDEPTAHLDATNEARLRHAVLAATTTKTLIWITHRQTGLDAFDQVVAMDRGRVVTHRATVRSDAS